MYFVHLSVVYTYIMFSLRYYRGTSGIDIDLRRVDIDQCPQRNVPGTTQPLNIFAGTDKCKQNTTEVSVLDVIIDMWIVPNCFPYWKGFLGIINVFVSCDYSVLPLLDLVFGVVRTSVSVARDSIIQIPVYRKNISTAAL